VRIHWIAGAAAGTMLLISLLLARAYPLLDPDEGRNAEVTREMAVSGHVVVPTLLGMPYLDKPPGSFAAGALAIRLFGATPVAVRLPSALAAALVIWLLGASAARYLPHRTVLLALALLATAPLFLILSSYVIFDMPLTLCVTALWLLIVEEIERGPGRLRRMAMFGAVTAGILIKGPVMLLWALGGSLGAALLLRQRSPLRWLRWPWGWLLVIGVAGGWFALASVRHPEYPRYAFLEESLERMATGSFHREQAFWFVPAVLVAGALPWSVVTPWTFRTSRMSKVGMGFVLFAVLFFSFSRSKLATYLLPCFPPMALVASESWQSSSIRRWPALWLAVLYATLALALVLIATGTIELPTKHSMDLIYAGAGHLAWAFAILTLLAALGGVARWRVPSFVALLAFAPVTLLAAGPNLVQYAKVRSGEPLGRAVSSVAPAGRVRFERCYSAGAEFTLGHSVDLLSDRATETTSTYQERYREILRARRQWTLLSEVPAPDSAIVVVRPAKDAPPPGMEAFFHDKRFIAYRRPVQHAIATREGAATEARLSCVE